jgi:hypothetical protein
VNGPIDGEVLALTSLANIQKNTLEVKVAIKDPPPLLRPEMLATVTFLAPAENTAAAPSESTERILIPRLLVEGSGESTSVWLVDARDRAQKRCIRLGRAGPGELIEVLSGEDQTIGVRGNSAGVRENMEGLSNAPR